MNITIETGETITLTVGPCDTDTKALSQHRTETFKTDTLQLAAIGGRLTCDLSDDRRLLVFQDRWAMTELGLTVSESARAMAVPTVPLSSYRGPGWPPNE